MKIWDEKELSLKDIKKIKSIKFSKSENSWIDYYHSGTPAFRVEKDYISGLGNLPPVDLIKFNIFCYSQKVLSDIIPIGFRIPDEKDWKNIMNNPLIIDKILTYKYKHKYYGEHDSFLFFGEDNFLNSSSKFLNTKPHKSFFIRDLERTLLFSFNNAILNRSNELVFRNIIDFAGYPRFMMTFIQ